MVSNSRCSLKENFNFRSRGRSCAALGFSALTGASSSFKEQREFETIDEDLAALEQQIKDCEEAQSACGSDYVKLQEFQAKQAELEAALEEKTERWMYLTELKEKIDAQ